MCKHWQGCAVLGIAFLLGAGASMASVRPGDQRNVLLLISDDHGLQAGCYGNAVIKTPNLDRLAASGVRFTSAFATVASCSASRSVIYTGLFNHANGQYGHQHAYHNFHTFTNLRSLPGILRERGYRTGIVAKFHVQPHSVYPFEVINVGARNVPAIAQASREFMTAEPDRPFLLVVGFADPHRSRKGFGDESVPEKMPTVGYRPEDIVVPRWLPDTPTVRKELVSYYRSVSRMDAGVGMILDALKEAGGAGNTLVIYISDNGPAFPGAKTTLYDPGIHLPLIVRCPTLRKTGIVNNAMVSWVDLVPTMLEWTGTKPPPGLQGRSFLGILGQENPKGWDTIFASHTFHEITMYYPMRVIRTRDYKYILNLAHGLDYPFASDLYASPTWQEVLATKAETYGPRRVDAYLHRPREELYYLPSDPDEVKNVAGDPAHRKALEELRARLKAWQKKTKDPWIVKYEYE
ncbi:MAG: sulfatase [Phycisphaerae bacterium]|nr:sulfatase [Phycisphaerae bacterium]